MTLPSSEPPDDTWTISSKSSQSTNEQVSIWVDEIEDQQQKKKSLNEAVSSIASGSTAHCCPRSTPPGMTSQTPNSNNT